MSDIIQFRQDTAANWTSINPTPYQGEPCFETDTGKFKIGDGITAWNSLAYTFNAIVTLTSLGLMTSATDSTLVAASGTAGHTKDTGILIGSNNEMSGELDTVVTDTSTARTLGAADAGKTIYFTNTSNITVTCPNSLLTGFSCTLVQAGNGQVQVIPAAGATVQNSYNTPNTKQLYSEIWARVSANSGGTSAVYTISGDVAGVSGIPAAASAPIIQSLQPFTITIPAGATSATLTITAVTAANSFINYQGTAGQASTFAAETCLGDVTVTNGTTITATRAVSDASNSITIAGTVVELKAGVANRIQQGTIAIGSGAITNTATITSVVANNTFVHFNGQTFSASTDNANFARCLGNLTLTNPTTITASRTTASTSTLTLRFVAVEFTAGTVLNSAKQIVSTANLTPLTGVAITQTSPLQTMAMFAGWKTSTTGTDSLFSPSQQDVGGICMIGQNPNATATPIFFVVEFLAGTITQKFQGNPGIAATTTSFVDTVPSAATGVSFPTFNGLFTTSSLSAFNTAWGYITQTSATQVTATRNTAHATIVARIPYTLLTFHA